MKLSESARKYFGDCARKGNAAMTPAQRKDRASKAAKARWSKRTDETDGDGKASGTHAAAGKTE